MISDLRYWDCDDDSDAAVAEVACSGWERGGCGGEGAPPVRKSYVG